MVDPISVVSGGISITQSILHFLGYIKGLATSDVISAHFSWDGTRAEGSDKIEIEKHTEEKSPETWWYTVKPLPDYMFVRIPLTASGIQELLGCVSGESNPDSCYWRWVALPKPGVIVGGNYTPPNAKVDFMVIGYKPKAVIKHFSQQ